MVQLILCIQIYVVNIDEPKWYGIKREDFHQMCRIHFAAEDGLGFFMMSPRNAIRLKSHEISSFHNTYSRSPAIDNIFRWPISLKWHVEYSEDTVALSAKFLNCFTMKGMLWPKEISRGLIFMHGFIQGNDLKPIFFDNNRDTMSGSSWSQVNSVLDTTAI